MTARTLVTAAVVSLGTLAVLALGGPGPAPRSSPPPGDSARGPAAPDPAPADFDLAGIRNVFRFGDEPGAETRTPSPGFVRATEEAAPASASGPRLVGLVRRAGGLLAAVAVEGEVVLLEPGGSALGYTVVEVSEEKVVIRDRDGTETVLPLGGGTQY